MKPDPQTLDLFGALLMANTLEAARALTAQGMAPAGAAR